MISIIIRSKKITDSEYVSNPYGKVFPSGYKICINGISGRLKTKETSFFLLEYARNGFTGHVLDIECYIE